MVQSIEQISRTDNSRANSSTCGGSSGSSGSSSNNSSGEAAAARLESALNVTSVEVEWERAECARADTASSPEDDVESSVSAATTASREAGRQMGTSIDRSIELNFYLILFRPKNEQEDS